jgi:hypothetical protein
LAVRESGADILHIVRPVKYFLSSSALRRICGAISKSLFENPV